MAAARPSFIEVIRIHLVRSTDGIGQGSLESWHDHQMNMIRHETVGDAQKMIAITVVPQEVKVLQAIFIIAEDHLLVVTPLRDMMRRPGNYDTR